MTMLYHYVFDWRLIVEACPEYEKYLEPITKSDEFMIGDEEENDWWTDDDNNDDPFGIGETLPPAPAPNPVSRTTMDLMEEGLVPVPAAVPVAGLPAEPDVAALRRRTNTLDEDEKSIIAEMHSSKPKESGRDLGMAVEAHEDTPRIRVVERQLKSEYMYYPKVDVPTLLLLPPPKKFLAPESDFYTQSHIHYKIAYGGSRNPDVVDAHYTRIQYKYPKLTIITTVYRFDRRKDLMSEKKKETAFTTYNFNTNRLYLTHKIPEPGNERGNIRNRYKKDVRQSSLHPRSIGACISIHETMMNNKFHRIIADHARSVMPDIYIPPIPRTNQVACYTADEPNTPICKISMRKPAVALSAIMMQLRVGKPLPWIKNEEEYLRVLELMEIDIIGRLFGDDLDMEEQDRLVRNYKKRYVYKLIAKLKESPKIKTIARAILGHHYRDLYYKILLLPKVYHRALIPEIARAVEFDNLPKSAYHFISYLVNNYYTMDCPKQLIDDYLHQVGSYLANDFMDEDADLVHGLTEHHATSYIKLVRKLIDKGDGNNTLRWTTWRDTFTMARDLGIRIRPNKFNSASDVQDMHDKLSEYQIRDISQRSEYNLYTFLKFDSPNKEYSGFKFVQLMKAEELVEEGKTMHHCVGGYSLKCLVGRSIIFSMSKDDRSWVTVELRGTSSRYVVTQKYTIKDFTIQNPEVLKAIEDWHSDTLGMHNNDEIVYAKLAKEDYRRQKVPILEAKRLEKRKKLEESGELDELKKSIENGVEHKEPVKRKELFDASSFELASA